MASFHQLRSIRVPVLGLSLVPLALLLVVIVVVAWLEIETIASSAWTQRSEDVLASAHTLQADTESAQSAVQQYELTGSPRSAAAFESAAAAVPQAAERIRQLAANGQARAALARRLSDEAVADIHDLRVVMNRLHRGDRQSIANAPNQDSLRTTLTRLESTENALVEKRKATSRRLWLELGFVLFAGTIIGGMVTLLLNLTFGWRIVDRLQKVTNQAIEFANDGAVVDPLKGRDEVADLSRSIHDLAIQIKERDAALIRYQLLAESVRDIILFARHSDGKILDANTSAAATHGYTRDELLGLSVADLHDPEAEESLTALLRRTEVQDAFIETMHRRKDGTSFPVEVAAQSVTIDGEHVVVCIVRDISERYASEQTIRKALNQAMEASRLKGDFVATMSHEIRTPMNGVVGMSELLLETPLTSQQREYATTARDSAHSLLGIINNILDFSKIEAGKVDLEVVEFDLLSQIEGIGAMLVPQAHAKQIGLMTYVDPAIPPRLLGDPVRLRQVLVNLAGNAIKFTSEGCVAVSADLISSGLQRAALKFSVTDTGVGIEPDVLPSLFDAFTQANDSTTRHYGGTGLGLTIAKQLVELMGGTIDVQSQPGDGSTFSFALTMRVGADVRGLPPRADVRGRRVLIVDDDAMSRDILSRYVSSWGMIAKTAQSSGEALDKLAASPKGPDRFDVAIVDLRLSGLDGIHLAYAIQRNRAIAQTKLLLVTAYDDPTIGPAAIRAGFSSYLTKPIRQSQLHDAISEALLGTPEIASRTAVRPLPVKRRDAILLAEDNAVNSAVALHQLTKLGYTVDAVGNGQEAVEKMKSGAYGLIFMDCRMPVMDGFEATSAIRKLESRTGKRVPVIAMTANALSTHRDACLAAGMDDYLTKPVALDDLRAVLKRWLGSQENEIIDRDHINGIFNGDRDAVMEFFASVVPSIGALCEKIAQTIEAPQLRELVHELKGAASNIGARELAVAAADLERGLMDGLRSRAAIQALITVVEDSWLRFRDAMDEPAASVG
ncbi:MAG TPA: response regulator [Candidatus Tumulicola sp.]